MGIHERVKKNSQTIPVQILIYADDHDIYYFRCIISSLRTIQNKSYMFSCMDKPHR